MKITLEINKEQILVIENCLHEKFMRNETLIVLGQINEASKIIIEQQNEHILNLTRLINKAKND